MACLMMFLVDFIDHIHISTSTITQISDNKTRFVENTHVHYKTVTNERTDGQTKRGVGALTNFVMGRMNKLNIIGFTYYKFLSALARG